SGDGRFLQSPGVDDFGGDDHFSGCGLLPDPEENDRDWREDKGNEKVGGAGDHRTFGIEIIHSVDAQRERERDQTDEDGIDEPGSESAPETDVVGDVSW